MSDEKLDKDLETEVDHETEATKVAEVPEPTKALEPPAEPTVTSGETRVSPATVDTQSEDGQKDAAAKRNRMVAAVACCLVALAALVGGVGYVSGAFAGADQTSQTVAAEKAEDASDDDTATQPQQTDQSKADEAVSADTTAAADQSAEQQQDQAAQTDASAPVDNGGSSNEGESSSGESSSYSGTDEDVEEESTPEPEPTPAPTPTPDPTPTPQPATITVYVTIDSSRANHLDSSWPTSMGSRSVTLSEDSSVYDALCAMGVSVGGNSTYVRSINGLSEKACGATSGWTYSVDGVFSIQTCGNYKLSGGETVCWIYSTDDEPTISM